VAKQNEYSSLRLTRTDIVDGGDGNDEAILSGASSLYFGEQLLLNCVHQLRPEVPRVQHDLMFQGDVIEHFRRKENVDNQLLIQNFVTLSFQESPRDKCVFLTLDFRRFKSKKIK